MILSTVFRTLNTIALLVRHTIITIPVRILKRLNGNEVKPYSLFDFSTEIFKLWILLLIGTILGLPTALLSVPAYLMLAILAEYLYVSWEDAMDFIKHC